MGDYQRLHTEAEGAEISPPVQPHIPSPVYHKYLCIASIIFTIGIVIFFIWGLPCDVSACNSEHQNSFSWDQTLYGVELKGRMHLVGGHVVCILRRALWGKDPESGGYPPHKGGVIALSASTGKLVWWFKLIVSPVHIDCSILGTGKCLILGENGYLAAIDPISGIISWRASSRNISEVPQPEDIDFPLVIPGRDGTGELVTLSRFKSGHHRLLFVSPMTGTIIDEPPVEKDCSEVYNLTYYNGDLHYDCSNRVGGVRIMKYKLKVEPKYVKSVNESPIDPMKKEIQENMTAGEHRVIWSNNGPCPLECSVSIIVMDSANKTVWTYSAYKSYVMTPLPLRFKPYLTGFLLKLWHWHKSLKLEKGMSAELIKERIVLITFNKSNNMHVVNASQTDITQLCYYTDCQPLLSFQTQSALLADVNNDGSQDLISYFVTYRSRKDDSKTPLASTLSDWELLSKVKVVRLESELPKLYDAVSKH